MRGVGRGGEQREGKGGEERGGEKRKGEGRGKRRWEGKEAGPAGAGPDSQTVAFALHFPAHPLRSQGANVLGEAKGPEQTWRQRRQRRESDQASRASAGQKPKGRPRQPQPGCGGCQRLLQRSGFEAAAPELRFSLR